MESNHSTIKGIIFTLCFLAAGTVTTLCLMSYFGITIPPELNTLAGGLVGALSGMLVKTTPTSTAPIETKVVNSTSNPVNTTEV